MIIPGAGIRREQRASQLIFHLRAADADIDALTGQTGTLTYPSTGTIPALQTRNGVSIQGARGLPRFIQDTTLGIDNTWLRLEAGAGQDQEMISYGFPFSLESLSIYHRGYPVTAAGTTLGAAQHLMSLGNDTTGGGRLYLLRNTTQQWTASRVKGGTAASVSVTDVGQVYPIETLVTFAVPAGTLNFQTRDAAGTVRSTGAPVTNASLGSVTDFWAGNVFLLNPIGNTLTGGLWRIAEVKIARGVLSFTQMDALS